MKPILALVVSLIFFTSPVLLSANSNANFHADSTNGIKLKDRNLSTFDSTLIDRIGQALLENTLSNEIKVILEGTGPVLEVEYTKGTPGIIRAKRSLKAGGSNKTVPVTALSDREKQEIGGMFLKNILDTGQDIVVHRTEFKKRWIFGNVGRIVANWEPDGSIHLYHFSKRDENSAQYTQTKADKRLVSNTLSNASLVRSKKK